MAVVVVVVVVVVVAVVVVAVLVVETHIWLDPHHAFSPKIQYFLN